MSDADNQAQGIRELLAATPLSLSEDQVRRLEAGESVELKEEPATRGRCSGIRIYCRTVGRFTCCLYLSFQNGRPTLCADCTS